MYLYRCRILYSKAVMDFFSNNLYSISSKSIVKVETKHGLDLAIYLDKTSTIDDKEFEEVLKMQAAIMAEENIDSIDSTNIDSSTDFLSLNSIMNKQLETNNVKNNIKIPEDEANQAKNGAKKRNIKIEGRFLGFANPEDIKIYKENEEKAKEAFEVFKQEIKACGLQHEMKPVGVHYFLDGMKILFDFVADHRIDFRELVKRLAARYRKRIELHQIGVRDEARMIDGLFICGQQLCCRRFLHQLTPISIKMAEVQNAPLNTMKISGYCGRLLCCLSYEATQYEKAKENLPELGQSIIYNNEKYIVAEVNVIRQYIKIKKKDSLEYILLKNESLEYKKDENDNIIITKSEIYFPVLKNIAK